MPGLAAVAELERAERGHPLLLAGVGVQRHADFLRAAVHLAHHERERLAAADGERAEAVDGGHLPQRLGAAGGPLGGDGFGG